MQNFNNGVKRARQGQGGRGRGGKTGNSEYGLGQEGPAQGEGNDWKREGIDPGKNGIYNLLQMGTLELTGWWAGQATDEEVAALSGRQICRMTYQMINDECSEFKKEKKTSKRIRKMKLKYL